MSGRAGAYLLSLALLGALGAGVWWWRGRGEQALEYVVQAGDTLSAISAQHGVSVEELKAWNGLSGDLIEIGQVLLIRRGGEAAPAAPAAPAPAGVVQPGGSAGGAAEGERRPRLSSPEPEPCIPFTADPGEEGMVAPAGLSHAQVKAALDAVLPEALYCPGAPSGRAEMVFTVTVGCDGVVDTVLPSGEVPGDFLDCVADVIAHADFPAHDIEGGQTFSYPVSASF